jgi:hypothetical protein
MTESAAAKLHRQKLSNQLHVVILQPKNAAVENQITICGEKGRNDCKQSCS